MRVDLAELRDRFLDHARAAEEAAGAARALAQAPPDRARALLSESHGHLRAALAQL